MLSPQLASAWEVRQQQPGTELQPWEAMPLLTLPGGLLSSRMGPSTCFFLDSLSYLVAAIFTRQLLVRPPLPVSET